MEQNDFSIIVIGGGHAGVEAAWAISQFDLKVGLLTLPGIGLASAPCNPAVGGIGKGQVVKEIDALGGLMAKLTDMAGIQYRTLNESKGYAVQSTRVQIDKELYSSGAEELVEVNSNIEVIRDKALSIEKDSDGSYRVTTRKSIIRAKAVIVTTGTFLKGLMHTGDRKTQGGRVGFDHSAGIEELLLEKGMFSKRFKTGTPPRLKVGTVETDKIEKQSSCGKTRNFHCLHSTSKRFLPQVDCYLTYTNSKTLEVIRKNKDKSPIFNGQIEGVGPRYCPSIEDKAFRHPDKDKHHVFIEPEGLNSETFYPSGISSSLPREIQLEFVRSLPGCENAEIKVFGYAVEYDVVDTSKLNHALECKEIAGLYFAGQVNGTSGYEEAAGQGLIAGLNAALSILGRDPFHLSRQDSYIGVMVEDLITNERDEPYRLFTARSENRLHLREDNALTRMMPYRLSLGLNRKIDKYLKMFHVEHEILSSLVEKKIFYPNESTRIKFKEKNYGEMTNQKYSLKEILVKVAIDPVQVLKNELLDMGTTFEDNVIRTVAIEACYEGYKKRMDKEFEKASRLSRKKINLEDIKISENISTECKQRILKIQPTTFGQLKSIIGLRPSTIAVIASQI